MKQSIIAIATMTCLLMTGCAYTQRTSETESGSNMSTSSETQLTSTENSEAETTVPLAENDSKEYLYNKSFISGSSEDGYYSVLFPDEQGAFNANNESYRSANGENMFLGFAYLRDTQNGTLIRVYDPALQYTAVQSFGDYKVKSASMMIHFSEGLYMNCVTLNGDIRLVGTVSEDTNGFVVKFSDNGNLPNLNPSGVGYNLYTAYFDEDCAYYSELKKATETGGEITLTADEISIAYKPAFGLSENCLSFNEFEISI